jgi:hypothetical protein
MTTASRVADPDGFHQAQWGHDAEHTRHLSLTTHCPARRRLLGVRRIYAASSTSISSPCALRRTALPQRVQYAPCLSSIHRGVPSQTFCFAEHAADRLPALATGRRTLCTTPSNRRASRFVDASLCSELQRVHSPSRYRHWFCLSTGSALCRCMQTGTSCQMRLGPITQSFAIRSSP